MRSEYIELGGMIGSNDSNGIDEDEFIDKFIEFVESNGWYFTGASGPYIEEENNDNN